MLDVVKKFDVPKAPLTTSHVVKKFDVPKAPLTASHGVKEVHPPKAPLTALYGVRKVHPPTPPLATSHGVKKVDPPSPSLMTFHGVKYALPPKVPLTAPATVLFAQVEDPGAPTAKLALEVAGEEQSKALSQILGGLETIAISVAAALGLDVNQLQNALDAAKNGDFTALDNLINDPATNPQMKNVLEAYQTTAQCLAGLQKDGRLDDQTLNGLENALKTLPPNAVTDSLQNTLADVKKWNEIGKKLESAAQDPESQGQGGGPGGQGKNGPATTAEIRSVVNQALAAAGYGGISGPLPSNAVLPAYGGADGYGVAVGSYAEPPVPAAPVAAATINLSNPAENSVTMPFLLNSQTTELQAGQYVELPTDRAWEIKFDRGEGFGVACYSLTDGLYQFTHTRQGWELVQGESAAQ